MKRFCQWFLKCTNPATGTLWHPLLGDVPICDRCRKIVDQLVPPTTQEKTDAR